MYYTSKTTPNEWHWERGIMEELNKQVEPFEEWKKEHEVLSKKFLQLDVNHHTETKNNLTYLSWAWAWQETLKICPTATYEVVHFKDSVGVDRCYQYDENLGYMVFTKVTINGLTREMWLPVMDNTNKTLLDHEYEIETRNGTKKVAMATMFDINKTIMRCLTKNLAMFGLGIYIYAGEDVPEEIGEPITAEQIARMKELNVNMDNVLKKFNVKSIEQLTTKDADFVIKTKEKALGQ